jgi:hypothetical protein
MAKGWVTIRTDRNDAATKAEVTKKARIAAKVIGSVKSKDYEGLKKEGIEAYNAVITREESILAAAAEDKLQSESLKKEATSIEKKRASKNKSE